MHLNPEYSRLRRRLRRAANFPVRPPEPGPCRALAVFHPVRVIVPMKWIAAAALALFACVLPAAAVAQAPQVVVVAQSPPACCLPAVVIAQSPQVLRSSAVPCYVPPVAYRAHADRVKVKTKTKIKTRSFR